MRRISGTENIDRKKVDNVGGLILIGVIWIIYDLIKAASEPTMTRKNWDNVEQWDTFNLNDKDFQKKLRGK